MKHFEEYCIRNLNRNGKITKTSQICKKSLYAFCVFCLLLIEQICRLNSDAANIQHT